MNRFEYLAALKEALSGLPEEMVQAVVADYERRIVERSAAGQSEDAILQALDDPAAVAAERRAAFQSGTFQARKPEQKQPANTEKRQNNAADVVGLMVFNLFLLGPLIAGMALLFATYVISLVSYGVGILVVAANLTGVGGVMLNDPVAHSVVMQHAPASDVAHGSADATPAADGDDNGQTRVDIGHSCVYVRGAKHHALNGLMLGINCISTGAGKYMVSGESRLLDGEPWSVSFVGIGMTLGGILLFLTCLVVSTWTWRGLRRLARMELSVLTNK